MICDRVEVSYADTDVAVDIATLSPDERLRGSRFRFERDRRRWFAARVLLRRVLGERLGIAPANLNFTYSDFGKPALAGSALRFNLTHSADFAACAIAEKVDIGIDIERIRPVDDIDSLFQSISSAREQEVFRVLPTGEKIRAFFETWTVKESCVKATGSGLTTPLAEIEVLTRRGASQRITAGCEGWSVFAWSPGRGYAGALALRTKPGRFLPSTISRRLLHLDRRYPVTPFESGDLAPI